MFARSAFMAVVAGLKDEMSKMPLNAEEIVYSNKLILTFFNIIAMIKG
jgi:hypothetical protein